MLFRKGIKKDRVNANLLGEHFDSIRAAIIEIRQFKVKKNKLTPTFTATIKVDIEKAWDACRNDFFDMYGILNEVAEYFQMEPDTFDESGSFNATIESFLKQLATVTFGVADALGTGTYSEDELKKIDEQILFVQKTATKLNNFVKEKFDFSE